MRLPGLSGRHPTTAPSGVGSRKSDPRLSLVGATVLGRYKVDGFLGEGSNAHVFVAHPADDPQQFVVVKKIKPHVLANPRFRQFFDGEVKSMSQFHHPYAVRLLDASLDEPVGPVMVLEYIPGVTLEQLLAKHRRLSPARAGRLMGFLLHALQAAHKAGIVHRDLKPANLMVQGADTPTEGVRVMDFGFAGFTAKPHIQLAELTGVGPVFACGTPAYVSPEMVRADAVDGRGDLYAVGVMLYELLTGRLPFDVPTADAMLEAHLRTPPPRFDRIGRDDLPPRLEAVVMTALAKYPNERHQSAKELCDDLSRAVGLDLWAATTPADESGSAEFVTCVLVEEPPAEPADPFVLSDTFEAMLPERLAATKLKGFVDDMSGVVVASEPGLIRVLIDPAPADRPATSSGLFSFLAANRGVPRGKEPIELDLKMHKVDANRVKVQVCFRPTDKYPPSDPVLWGERCEAVYSTLRKYVMAG